MSNYKAMISDDVGLKVDPLTGKVSTIGRKVGAGLVTREHIDIDPVTNLIADPVHRAAVGEAASLRNATLKSALQALSMAASRRVDVVMIGDSNQGYNAYGFATGISKALNARFGCYATGIVFKAASANFGSGWAGSDESGVTADTGGASFLSLKWAPSATTQGGMHYGHLASGTTYASGGVTISPVNTGDINITAALKGWFSYAAAKSYSGGSFVPGARLSVSPFSAIGTGTSQSTTGDFDHVQLTSVSISADASRAGKGIEFRYSVPGGTAATGPFSSVYARVENPAKTTGVSCHTLYYMGGQSAWNMAADIIGIPDQTLTTYFAEVRRLQVAAGQTPMVVVYMNSGLNDRNEPNTPSLGPNPSTSPTSADAYVDNLRAVQNRIRYIWRINNWPEGELYWLFVPSHPISTPDDTALVSYRTALSSAVSGDPQTSMVNLASLTTYDLMNANGWYAAGQAQMHLTNAGYDGLGSLIASQIP